MQILSMAANKTNVNTALSFMYLHQFRFNISYYFYIKTKVMFRILWIIIVLSTIIMIHHAMLEVKNVFLIKAIVSAICTPITMII